MLEVTLFKILEWLAVLASLTYIILAIKEKIWCWFFAAISTTLYIFIFWDVALLMDSLLNAYYLLMAAYGYYSWTHPKNKKKQLRIQKLGTGYHLIIITAILIFSVLAGSLLAKFTSAAWPYLDSFTTVASLAATFMVARKILDNWLYWIVIDLLSIVLYIERGLYPTAALFFLYTILAIYGYVEWKKSYFTAKNEQK